MTTTSIHRALIPVALATLAVGCDTTDDPGVPSLQRPAPTMRQFADCPALKSHLVDVVTEELVQNRYGFRGGVLEDGAVDAPADDDAGGGGDAPTDYTTTNVQEEGVDELDLLKSEGTHMYVAEDRGVHILSTWPADETEVLATLDLQGWAHGLFLVDDKLVVFNSVESDKIDGDWDRSWQNTRVSIVDITDRTDPMVERTVDLEGYLADARLIDGKVTFAVNQRAYVPSELWDLVWSDELDLPEPRWEAPEGVWEQAEADARALLRPEVEAVLADMDVSEWLPRWQVTDGGVEQPAEAMLGCTDLYAPETLSPLSVLSVVQLDPADATYLHADGILSDGWQLYASVDNVYVAQSSRWWWGWEDEVVSHIHKFTLTEDGPDYVGSGEVEGWLYDQFAMSEYDGHLRVVTTDFRSWWGFEESDEIEEPANHVYVLEDAGEGLEVVGHVDGIAPGEQIMAARMMGEKGYIITFEQIDPLFTLDLSEPTDPRVVGELKIPGYSAYLHPMGEDHLLAVGMDGLDDGTLTGLAVNIFDVSDMADPQLIHTHAVQGEGWSWSEALWDHHAFTYHREVLTIPAFLESYDEVNGWEGFSGTISFRATPDEGITELGRVDHRDLVADSECLWTWWYDWGEGACDAGSDYWYARVRRAAYVEDNLYTISDYGVKVNDLDDPSIEHTRALFYPAD